MMNKKIEGRDILIVGAGAVGMATAIALAREGMKVSIVEKAEVGRESSWAGGGILSPLPNWNFREEVTRLTGWGEALWPEWAAYLTAETGVDTEYIRSGMMVLPDYDEALAMSWCQAHGVPLEKVVAKEREPALAHKGEALVLTDVAQVRNPRLLQAMRLCLGKLGVSIHEHTEVTGWRREGSRVAAVETTQGAYSADEYMICGGAWNQPLSGDLAGGLDIWPVRGQILALQAEPGLLGSVVLSNGYYLVPRRDGLILAGTTRERVGFDKSATPEARAEIMAVARDLVPALREDMLVSHWAGLRPGSPDNVPVLGRHWELENLSINGGHFRYGVTMAPACAEVMANLLFGRPQPIEMQDYRWMSNPGPQAGS